MEQQEQNHESGRRRPRSETARRLGVVVAVAVLALCAAGAGAAAPAWSRSVSRSPAATVVTTEYGEVRGRLATNARIFQGIPYAAPPVGELRWASPQPAASWTGIRDATRPGNRCAQAEGLIDRASSTEDCLYLNVTTPRHSSGGRLPVMVWIHGNGFISGAGSLYDAQQLASSGNVIVVSPNYRLGIFGFLAHPALDHGPARNLSGNFGLEDQQAALQWVQRNAAAFGGDPGNVTIFGESAGGTSVCAQLAAPGSAGLFQKAIVQSGQCAGRRWSPGPPTWFPLPRSEREQHGVEVAAKVGCSDPVTAAECLRAKPAAELAKWSDDGVGSGPTVGDGMLPLSPEGAFAAGRFNRVPVIEGITRDEHRLFTAAIEAATGQPTTPAGYREQLDALFPASEVERILERYPVGRFHSAGEALSAVVTDWAWGCAVRDQNRVLAANTPLYAYEFADESAPWFTTLAKPDFPTGAFHGAELQYLFADEQLPGPVTASQRQLSATMIEYWTRFASTGDPNGGGQPQWLPFRSGDHVQSLAPAHIGSADLAREHQCTFWESLDG